MGLSAEIHWLQGLGFEVHIRDHHQFADAKKEFGGKDRGPNPKEYVLAGLCSCTGMDVVSLLKKYKVDYSEFSVSAEADLTKNHPVVFTEIKVLFAIKSKSQVADQIKKAIELSMTKYCGVSAMLSKSVNISYVVLLNDQEVANGKAVFENI